MILGLGGACLKGFVGRGERPHYLLLAIGSPKAGYIATRIFRRALPKPKKHRITRPLTGYTRTQKFNTKCLTLAHGIIE